MEKQEEEKEKGIVILRFLLSGFDEFFPAFRAGDGDFSLALGYPYLLVAAGAVVIAVFLVLELLEEEQKLSVFLITLVDIPGEGAEDSHDHEDIGHGGEQQL